MSENVPVGVADLKVANNSSVLASYGLGSCVAVGMYDQLRKVGGLAHVMLPDSRGRDTEAVPGKFADSAIVTLIKQMKELGARQIGIRCKIAGGSQMFDLGKNQSAAGNIGARNVEAVKAALAEAGIQLVAEDTGGNYGRTVKFETATGKMEISSISHGSKTI